MTKGTSDEAIETLRRLRAEGASVARVAVAIKRSKNSFGKKPGRWASLFPASEKRNGYAPRKSEAPEPRPACPTSIRGFRLPDCRPGRDS